MTPGNNQSDEKIKGRDIFQVKKCSQIAKPLYWSSNVRISNVQKETLFLFLKEHFLKKMAGEIHVDLKKIEKYMRNKAFTEEILCDKGKKSSFWKASENFLF